VLRDCCEHQVVRPFREREVPAADGSEIGCHFSDFIGSAMQGYSEA
jgi:hypothetical protein